MDIDVSREQQAAESRQAQIDFVYQSVAGLCNLEHRLIGDPAERMKEIFVAILEEQGARSVRSDRSGEMVLTDYGILARIAKCGTCKDLFRIYADRRFADRDARVFIDAIVRLPNHFWNPLGMLDPNQVAETIQRHPRMLEYLIRRHRSSIEADHPLFDQFQYDERVASVARRFIAHGDVRRAWEIIVDAFISFHPANPSADPNRTRRTVNRFTRLVNELYYKIGERTLSDPQILQLPVFRGGRYQMLRTLLTARKDNFSPERIERVEMINAYLAYQKSQKKKAQRLKPQQRAAAKSKRSAA
jgi:hypothetical protein